MLTKTLGLNDETPPTPLEMRDAGGVVVCGVFCSRMHLSAASRSIPAMGLVGWMRFARAEQKIRCKNCATVSADLDRGFCSDECRVDYMSISDAEWQAHG